jgi:hypothetical protein
MHGIDGLILAGKPLVEDEMNVGVRIVERLIDSHFNCWRQRTMDKGAFSLNH